MAKLGFSLSALLRAKCPACQVGGVLDGIFAIRDRCPHCNYNLHPEPGFYLGAMMVGFFVSAALTIPPVIALKMLDVDTQLLLAFPFIEFIFVGTFVMFYSRIVWLHFEYRMTDRLDGSSDDTRKDRQ